MAGGQAILPAFKSIQQGVRLNNLPDISRPDFQIPKAATEQLDLARTLTSNRNMPSYNEELDKIENQTNRVIGDAKAAGGNMQDIMAAMAAANMQAGMQKRDLDIMNDKNYLGTLQNLQTQLGQFANWQNAEQQDKTKAYNDEMARRNALSTASQQNMMNAVNAVGQGAATGLGYKMNSDLMDKQFQNNLALQTAGFNMGLNNATSAVTPAATSAVIPSSTTVNPTVQPAVTAQASAQMPFSDFSQVVTRDQFVNADFHNNMDLLTKISDSTWDNKDRMGISDSDLLSAKLGKYYDWIIANQGSITPQMSAYPIMESMYNMYKK
jgi:hypothetical protein